MGRWLIAVSGFLVVLVWILHLVFDLPGSHLRNDFGHYYLSSHLLLEGQQPYGVTLEPLYASFGIAFDPLIPSATNPPALLVLFAPFAAMPPPAAAAAWALVQFLCLLGLLALTRTLVSDKLTNQQWAWYLIAVGLSLPLYHHFYHSQIQLLLACVALFAYWLHERGRFLLAAMCIAAIGMLKLFPLVLLPWFVLTTKGSLSYRFACLAAAAGTMVGIVLLTDVWLWQAFVEHAMPIVSENASRRNNSLPSFIVTVGHALFGPEPPAAVATTIRAMTSVASLGSIALGYAICFAGAPDRRTQFCLLSTIMLIASMITWSHYLVFLVFPIAVVLPRVLAMSSAPRAICLLGLSTLALDTVTFPLWVMVALVVTFTRTLFSGDAEPKPVPA